MIIKRKLQDKIATEFFRGKVVILTGGRQVGKTTLANSILSTFPTKKILRLNCDNPSDRELLQEKDLNFLRGLVETYDIVFIDEGQKVPSIGQTLKLLIDHYQSKKQFFVTGSSSFHLLNLTNEALTGRKRTFELFPVSFSELAESSDVVTLKRNFSSLMIYGQYPEIVANDSFTQKEILLDELVSSNLYRDIFEFQLVRNSSVLFNLLKALALQVGNEVSYNELSRLLGIDNKTVERYIDLLEQNYIIFRLSPLYSNKRKEISKAKKVYFYDLGIRNTIIKNYAQLEQRNDAGALFENLMMIERIKTNEYNGRRINRYFWRTYTGQEIDLVEEENSQYQGFEFKLNKDKTRSPKAFSEQYQLASLSVINQHNYNSFLNLN